MIDKCCCQQDVRSVKRAATTVVVGGNQKTLMNIDGLNIMSWFEVPERFFLPKAPLWLDSSFCFPTAWAARLGAALDCSASNWSDGVRGAGSEGCDMDGAVQEPGQGSG